MKSEYFGAFSIEDPMISKKFSVSVEVPPGARCITVSTPWVGLRKEEVLKLIAMLHEAIGVIEVE